jgi:transposase-like protein
MSNSVDRVEVFAGIQRRRKYSADQKLAVVQEAAQPGMTISYVARRHGIAPSLIFGWRRRMSASLGDAESEMSAFLAERTWDSAIGLYLNTQIRKNSSH